MEANRAANVLRVKGKFMYVSLPINVRVPCAIKAMQN
jgi:hypothetical protein